MTERRADTGLCQACQKAAEAFFGVAPDQAMLAVMGKKTHQNFTFDGLVFSVRDRVRCLVLASGGTILGASVSEKYNAISLRLKYPQLTRLPLAPEATDDFMEGIK